MSSLAVTLSLAETSVESSFLLVALWVQEWHAVARQLSGSCHPPHVSGPALTFSFLFTFLILERGFLNDQSTVTIQAFSLGQGQALAQSHLNSSKDSFVLKNSAPSSFPLLSKVKMEWSLGHSPKTQAVGPRLRPAAWPGCVPTPTSC